jgi:CRISPR-associated protein Csm1
MADQELLAQSSRVALAALLHDLGKLAERAGIESASLAADRTNYCPFHQDGGYHSHVHAAYTGAAWVALEETGHFPDLRKGCAPFLAATDGQSGLPDSAVNAAASHHRPDTFLQWIVATADRVASGFERDKFEQDYNRQKEDNHYRARLLTLFEQIGRGEVRREDLSRRYPLEPLSPRAIFPRQAADCTPPNDATARAEYHALWDALLEGIRRIPPSHRNNLPLWLDHFDSLWLTITQAIPSATAFGVKPEVSLYDHCKATTALAAALWRWHHENGLETVAALKEGWDTKKFLLVQGDFFGIQDFIFAEGGQTQKHAHKLLRGRSFQVSLLAECAALMLLDALQLPSTSQIINAAGKFLIVAPDTAFARQAIADGRKVLNAWCLEHTYGEIGVGIATTPASCNDFTGGRFGAMIETLFAELDSAKHRRFDLCGADVPAVFDGFLDRFDNTLDVCKINGRYPADRASSNQRGYALSMLADDQIRIGEALTKRARVLVTRDRGTLPALGLDYFGYRLSFVAEEEIAGKYGELARNGTLLRAWDFDAADADGRVFRGYARRFVNAYVPTWSENDQTLKADGKYLRSDVEQLGESAVGNIKTLHVLALEDGADRDNTGKYSGEIALLTIKGDIDNLGGIFQQGLEKPTFAKMAALSRQINAFFALWLPWFCEHGTDANGVKRYRNTYTVFAGGDDFFLIGPWESTLALAGALREKFADYVVNDSISFSAGMVMTHPKTPVRQLARRAEDALDAAKHLPGKNAATLWNRSVHWHDWRALMNDRSTALEALMARADSHGANFSTGLTYALLQLSDRSESQRPTDAIWRSQLHYRLTRFFRDRVKGDEEKKAQRDRLLADAIKEIGGALQQYKGAYRLPLSALLYRQRD